MKQRDASWIVWGMAIAIVSVGAGRCASLTIEFDYSYDQTSHDFFADPTRRELLETAASIVTGFGDQLTAIDASDPIYQGPNFWQASFLNPTTGLTTSYSNLVVPEDTMIVFVGGRDDLTTTLAVAGDGSSRVFTSNDPAFNEAVETRGQPGASDAPPTDYGPWGGSVGFNINTNWGYAGSSGAPESGKYDFLSVAIHELTHILGFGTAASWSELVQGGQFTGPNAMAANLSNPGQPVPVGSGRGHWAEGTRSLVGGASQEAAMDPTINLGTRKWLTDLDTAALVDIGWGSSGGPSFRLADPSDHVPEPVDFGSLHVGDVAMQALSITNQAPNDGLSERLSATMTAASGDTNAFGSFALLAPGSTDASSLVVRVETAGVGAKIGTATISLLSDGTGTSGAGTTALPSQTVNVSATVYRFASPSTLPPETIDFGNVHAGDLAEQTLPLSNNAVSDGFSERLNASFSVTSGAATGTGSISQLSPGSSDTSSLVVGIDTTTAGTKNGTATVQFESDGSGTSGLGITSLPSASVDVAATVYRLAEASAPSTVNLGNVHVGDLVQQSLSVSNNAAGDGFSERLNASFSGTSGAATGFGSISQLSPGSSDATSLVVGIDTATAGAKTGTATVAIESDGTDTSGLGITSLPSASVDVTATVYRLASPSAVPLDTVDFGTIHVGDVLQKALPVTNTAANDGFSERLNARIGAVTGQALATGQVDRLMPGAEDSTSLVVAVDTTMAGTKTGMVTIDFSSDAAGISELGETPLPGQSWTVTLAAQVNNYANPTLVELSNTGDLTQDDTTHYTLDLGVALLDQVISSVELGLLNDVASPADELGGTWTVDAPGFVVTGFDPTSGIAPGATLAGFFVDLNTSTAGDFAGQLILTPTSDDSVSTSLLSEVTIDLVGTVVQSIAGDLNYDGIIDFDDMSGFVLGLNDPAAYEWQFGRPAHLAGDMDGDGDLDFDDISGFVTALSAPPLLVESHSVPEPPAIALVAIAVIAITLLRSGRRGDGTSRGR